MMRRHTPGAPHRGPALFDVLESPHYAGAGGYLARDHSDEIARTVLMTPLATLLGAAENADPGQARRFAEAARLAAERLDQRPPVLGQRTYPLASVLLRELAARADHHATLHFREGRIARGVAR